MYDFGKRIAGLAAFIIVASTLIPTWSPSQTAEQYQLNDHDRKINSIENTLPTLSMDIAVMKEHLTSMDRRAIETQQSVDSVKATGMWIVFGMLAWMAKEIFGYFGAKAGVKNNKGD